MNNFTPSSTWKKNSHIHEHREFRSMQSYFSKIMTFCSVLVFPSSKMRTRNYLRNISLSKRKVDRKISKIFPTIYHQTMFYLSTEFNHKVFLSHSSDWCSNAADCRTTRCEWKVYFSELLLCVVSWCQVILHTKTPVGRFIVSFPQVYFGFVVIVIVYTKF